MIFDYRQALRRTTAVCLTALALTAFTDGAAAAEERGSSVPPTACGAALGPQEAAEIASLSETAGITGASRFERLTAGVTRLHAITDILTAHRDRRGLFPLGLGVVESEAVLPLESAPGTLTHPEWAHAVSEELLYRFLDNVHAEFTGHPPEPQWAHYFRLAGDCSVSPARIAMIGYNAHLTVDLAHSIRDSGTGPEHIPDYYRIVDTIASDAPSIIASTKTTYGADLGPLWRFYFVGEGLDRLTGSGQSTALLLRAADAGYNTITLRNGLALQDPARAAGVEHEITELWATTDRALQALSELGGL